MVKVRFNTTFLDHISFRIENQLFFVRIEDVENELVTPVIRWVNDDS